MNFSDKPVIVWFRQDLRLRDNPALEAAHDTGQAIIPVYILDDDNCGDWRMGAASRWWLQQSLLKLNASLQSSMVFERGDPLSVLTRLVRESGATAIFWNRCYEPWRIDRDTMIKRHFTSNKNANSDSRVGCVQVKSFNGASLFEPVKVLKADGTPYRVFTPFYNKACLAKAEAPRVPRDIVGELRLTGHKGLPLEELDLMPSHPWHEGLQAQWQPGEQGAQKRLKKFLNEHLKGYKEGRDFPGRNRVSRLSPHLHYGEISPNDVWYAVKNEMVARGAESDGELFLRELGWREFSHNLLYHFPDLPTSNLQPKFNHFGWQSDASRLRAWQRGRTGYPIVDAGMRELWQTGYMHNRVRMIVASFLVKNLLIDWREGQQWFWDTLVDADLANNAASWQWVAGSGADAAPFFRIFNPVTQGQKFDKEGRYVRQYVPELAALPNKYLHSPWLSPKAVLDDAKVSLGVDYPKPIVDAKISRQRALTAFKQLTS